MSDYYSAAPRDSHDLTNSFNDEKSTGIALSRIFDALNEAMHRRSYVKVVIGGHYNSGMIESYTLDKVKDNGWELHMSMKGQSNYSTSVYSSSLDGNSDVFVLTNDSVFVLAKKLST